MLELPRGVFVGVNGGHVGVNFLTFGAEKLHVGVNSGSPVGVNGGHVGVNSGVIVGVNGTPVGVFFFLIVGVNFLVCEK